MTKSLNIFLRHNTGYIMSTYLYIDGIPGNVTTPSHIDWIQLNSIGFGINRHINTLPGQIYDRQLTQPAISEIEARKDIDISSVLLFQYACTAKVIPHIKVDLCQTNHDGNPYAQYELTNVILTQYRLTPQTEIVNHRPGEAIKFNYEKIEFRYTPYNQNNEPQNPLTTGYDLKNATKI